jgi:ABC-type transport system involved in multi-copper enzyme maturation permease subunit
LALLAVQSEETHVIGSIRAEWLKLWRRPATWVLGGILCCSVFTLGYLLVWLGALIVERTPPSSDLPDPATLAREIRAELVPANFLGSTLSLFGGLGGAIALILGALSLGSEYGWGTLKTILTQGPNRLVVVGGKVLALAGALLAFTAGALVSGLVGSLLIAAIEGTPMGLPGAARMLGAVGAGWLMLAAWTALGLALAALLRSTALAIGLGLVYALIVENVVGGITFFVEPLQFLERVFVGTNSNALAGSFVAPGRIPALQSSLVLGLYAAAFVALTMWLVRRQDIT